MPELVSMIVEPAEPLVDAVFDRRTGYHVVTYPAGFFDGHPRGEGNGDIFEIRRGPASALDRLNFWRDTEDGPEPVCKLSPVALERRKLAPGPLLNVYEHDSAVLTTDGASKADWLAKVRQFDTRHNAMVTVGTGKDQASISGAITVSSSGDHIRVYAGGVANTYTENVADGGKQLDIVVDNGVWQQITLTTSSGDPVNLTGNASSIQGFIVDGSHAANNGVILSGYASYAYGCEVHSVTAGLARGITLGTTYAKAVNCLARGCTTNYIAASSEVDGFFHCHADGGSYGFRGAASNWGAAVCCTAVNTATADFSQLLAARCKKNASEDATAASFGAGSATGLMASDYTNYRLKASVAATTKALLYGEPELCWVDIDNNTRKREGTVYAGPSDPDPASSKNVVTPTFTGTPTIARIDGQNGLEIDLSGCSIADADIGLVYVRDGDTPTTDDSTYLAGSFNTADGTIRLRQDAGYDFLTSGGDWHIKLGVVSESGDLAVNSTELIATAAGYLELAD